MTILLLSMPDSFEHMPAIVIRMPNGALLRHGRAMLAHTFRGSPWKTWLRLEPEREAFRRYRDLRKQERVYL